MADDDAGDRGAPRRSQRLDTVAKKVIAIASGVGVIAGAVAGVRELIPESAKPAEPHATLGDLKLRVQPLTDFVRRSGLIASAVPASASGHILVASSGGMSGVLLLAQATTETTAEPDDTTTETTPESDDTTTETTAEPDDTTTETNETTPGTATTGTDTQPSTTPTVPAVPGGRTTSCVQGVTVSPATTLPTPLVATTPPAPTTPAATGCDVAIPIPPEDLEKPVADLRKEVEHLAQEVTSAYALPDSCMEQPPPDSCPLVLGMKPVVPAESDASPATRNEATKLALLRQELKVLRDTRFIKRDGQRVPVGVELDYTLRLCGFGGKSLKVVWSLYKASLTRPLPHSWQQDRPAYPIKPKSSACQTFFENFWVPWPRTKGRLEVTLVLVDEDRVRRSAPVRHPFPRYPGFVGG